jgi:hypothetical protein
MSFFSSGNKVRSFNEIKDGETYRISDNHQEFLVTVLKRMEGSFLGQMAKSKSNQTFNWNNDFVFGQQEIYTISD